MGYPVDDFVNYQMEYVDNHLSLAGNGGCCNIT